MKTFKYTIKYNEQETKTIATINIRDTITAIDKKYPGMLAAYELLAKEPAFSQFKFTGVANLDSRDVPIIKIGNQFAAMKARRKAKKYLQRRFSKIQKVFYDAATLAYDNRVDYDTLFTEEDRDIRSLADNYEKITKSYIQGFTGEIYIYARNKKYWITDGQINMDGHFYPIDNKFKTKQDVIDYFSGKGGRCGRFSDKKIDFAFLDKV